MSDGQQALPSNQTGNNFTEKTDSASSTMASGLDPPSADDVRNSNGISERRLSVGSFTAGLWEYVSNIHKLFPFYVSVQFSI